MRPAAFIFALLLTACAVAQVFFPARRPVAIASFNPCDTSPYLVLQNFETPTTGYDHCETWVEQIDVNAFIDPAYTGIVLQGTQSLDIGASPAAGAYTRVAFADKGEIWVYYLMRPVVLDATFFRAISSVRLNGGSVLFQLQYTASSTLRVLTPNQVAETVSTISAGTTYHVWLHFKKGTGANASASVGFSTTGIRPTSGNNFAEVNSGSAATDMNNFELGAGNSYAHEFVYDTVRISDTVIGDNPP